MTSVLKIIGANMEGKRDELSERDLEQVLHTLKNKVIPEYIPSTAANTMGLSLYITTMGMYNGPVDNERAASDHHMGQLNSDHRPLKSLNASNPLLHLNKFKYE